MPKTPVVNIIGGGLAGSEAAYFLLKKGVEVHLYEMRPEVGDGAHSTSLFGELVCSNSLKSKQPTNCCGLLKMEMASLGSIMMEASEVSSIPGGNALTVDREIFAKYVTDKLSSFPNLTVHREEVKELPSEGLAILATGPLTSDSLSKDLEKTIGGKNLSFFDASAPIVKKDSIDFSKAYFKSRFEQNDDAYINCPFTKEEYFAFVNELTNAKKALLHEFDTHYFEGCLPIEVMASRGVDTLRYGTLTPRGLWTEEHPHPYAVAQLRQDTKLGDCYNLVGFQTNLTYPEQKRVFSMIPGLEHAEFVKYGLMHRNSYINSRAALNADMSLKNKDNIFVSGQLMGVEGYVESAATGIIAGINAYRRLNGKANIDVSKDTVIGLLLDYVLNGCPSDLKPMNACWALFSDNPNKKDREFLGKESLKAIDSFKMSIDE